MADIFNYFLKRVATAKGDPQAQAALSAEFALEVRPEVEHEPLRAALDAAAVLHWFNATILGRVLEIPLEKAMERFEDLKLFPFVECYSRGEDEFLNVHESTRLGWRRQLAREFLERFRDLSTRAAKYFSEDQTPFGQIEYIYHFLCGNPEQGADELERIDRDWEGNAYPEDYYALAGNLMELEETGLVTGRNRARMLLVIESVHGRRSETNQLMSLATEALRLAKEPGAHRAKSDAHYLIGDVPVNWAIDKEPSCPQAGAKWTWRLHSGRETVIWNFRWIPPTADGRPFRMGARGWFPHEEPVHERTVSNGFWLLDTPVTQTQYFSVTEKKPFKFHCSSGAGEHPAVEVTWLDAKHFLQVIGTQLHSNLRPCWYFDLPNEVQWEYACRAGTETDFYTGDGDEAMYAAGWCNKNGEGRTHPVREKEKNAWGLYDLHGNIWEWCRGPYSETAWHECLEQDCDERDSSDFEGSNEKCQGVLRGGGFWSPARECRSAFRYHQPRNKQLEDTGFRFGLFSKRGGGSSGGMNVAQSKQTHLIQGNLLEQDQQLNWFVEATRTFRDSSACAKLGGWNRYICEYGNKDLVERFKESFPERPNPEGYVPKALEVLDDHRYGIPSGQHHYRNTGNAKPGVITWPNSDIPDFESLSAVCLWSFADLVTVNKLPQELRILDLRYARQLTHLPVLPTTIETLDLTGCERLRTLPEQCLPNLKYLYLGGCASLTATEVNRFISHASAIREIELFDSPFLEQIPSLEYWIDLRHINLSGCSKLTELPELAHLDQLEHLNLEGCSKLTELPELPVKSLKYLCLHGCASLRNYLAVDLSVRDFGERPKENVVNEFLFKTATGKTSVASPRCKLIMLGNGRAGKTTLAKALQWMDLGEKEKDLDLKPCENEESTHSVHQYQWYTRLGDLNAVVNIWDFGGQELYHGTHRTFAAGGSLFLIVHTAAVPSLTSKPVHISEEDWVEYNRNYPIQYWIDYVRDLDRNAKIILVETQRPNEEGDVSRVVEDTKAQYRYSEMIVGTLKVDSLETDPEKSSLRVALQTVKKALEREIVREGIRIEPIRAKAIEEVRQLATKTTKLHEKDSFYSWKEWCDFLKKLTTSNHLPAMTDKFRKSLTLSMHRLGELFWVQSKNIVLINQKAAIKEIYRILNYQDKKTNRLRESVKQNYGIFDASRLLDAYSTNGNNRLAEFLLEFMVECRVCVRLFRPTDPGVLGSPLISLDPSLLPIFAGDVQEDLDAEFYGSKSKNHTFQKDFSLKDGKYFSAAYFRDLQGWAVQIMGNQVRCWRNGLQFVERKSRKEQEQHVESPLCFRLEWVPPLGENTSYSGFLRITVHSKKKQDTNHTLSRIAGLLLTDEAPFPWQDWVSRAGEIFPYPNEKTSVLIERLDVAISVRKAQIKIAEVLGSALDKLRVRVFLYSPETRLSMAACYNRIRQAEISVLIISNEYLSPDSDNVYCQEEFVDAILKWSTGCANQKEEKPVYIIYVNSNEFDFNRNFLERAEIMLKSFEEFCKEKHERVPWHVGSEEQYNKVQKARGHLKAFCAFFTDIVDQSAHMKFPAPNIENQGSIDKLAERIQVCFKFDSPYGILSIN